MHNGKRVRLQCWYLVLCCWQKFRNSRLVGGILAVVASLAGPEPARLDRCCWVNWLTFICRTSHAESRYRSMQANGCRRVHWSLEGRSKARNTVIKPHCLLAASTCSIARSKFDVKISMVKIFAVFIFVSRGFIRNIRKLAPYENFPLYGIILHTHARTRTHTHTHNSPGNIT